MGEYTLENGLKIIQEDGPTDVVYCGLIVGAGTRDEDAEDSGLAHFCEHASFKGTLRRKAWRIRNCLEGVGGDLNAYTGKEETVYYATVLKEDFSLAADLLTDIVFGSVYPMGELKREVEVIVDEIDSYRDSPAELIYDEFEGMLFRNHGLGRDILGRAERLREYSTDDALRFTQRFYHPANATFFVYGSVSWGRIVDVLGKCTSHLSFRERVKSGGNLPAYRAERRCVAKDTHQAHVLIGNRGYGIHHPWRVALFLLNNILGGPGMNSLLNVDLREKRGLVYTVESSLCSYSDAGVWGIYFGCDEGDVEICLRRVNRILAKLRDEPLSRVRLEAAKKQLIGQVLISCDNFESYALALGKTYAHTGEHRDMNCIIEKIKGIKAEDLCYVAEDLFKEDDLSILIYR